MMSSSILDVALIIRAPASRFPPTINQANILAENGCTVAILEATVQDGLEGSLFHPGIRRLSVGSATDFNESYPNIWQRWEARRSFLSSVSRRLQELRPRVVIAYDPDSIFGSAQWAKMPGVLSIAHLHELPDDQVGRGLVTGRMNRLVKVLGAFGLVIFPDPFRAAAFMARWNAKQALTVVYNCARRKEALSPIPFAEVPAGAPVVLYQGVISASRGVLPVLQSMAWWPGDSHLVLRGVVVNEFAERLLDEARKLGVAERVHITHQPAYGGDTINITAGAKIGVALYQGDQDLNTRFSAFASNKIFEYLAAGIPVLAPEAFGYRELIDLQQLGQCVDPQDPRAIGESIAGLLGNQKRWRTISENAREIHLQILNYEHQFGPVVARIAEHLGKGKKAQAALGSAA